MGLVLTVREAAWRAHVRDTAARLPDLIPVVKGNGYGFGRALLGAEAARLTGATGRGPLSTCIAVGTVHEVADVPADRHAMVLTPEMGTVPDLSHPNVLLTVGSTTHVEHLARSGWRGQVVLKLRSSMLRYGIDADDLSRLHSAARAAGLEPVAYALHLPLAGDPGVHVAEVEAWLAHLDPALPLALSHVDHDRYLKLRSDHPERHLALRAGTALWHGDKSMLALTATVNDVRAVRAGDVAGYHSSTVPCDGHLVMIGAGSTHGVAPLDDGRSPFHFARRRLLLLERPHMHTSMVVVPDGDPCPAPGDAVDVQRPLTQTHVDRVEWLP